MSSNKKISRKAKILPQFSIYSGNKPPLDLLEIQRKSFCDLLERGIIDELSKTDIFRETAKFSGFTQELELVFNPDTYKLVSPNCTPKEAILKGKTYACKLYVQATLTIRFSPRGSAGREGRELEKQPSVVPRFSLASSQPLHNEKNSIHSVETTRKPKVSLETTLPLKYSEKSLRYLQSLQPAQPAVSWTQGSRSMERSPIASNEIPCFTRRVCISSALAGVKKSNAPVGCASHQPLQVQRMGNNIKRQSKNGTYIFSVLKKKSLPLRPLAHALPPSEEKRITSPQFLSNCYRADAMHGVSCTFAPEVHRASCIVHRALQRRCITFENKKKNIKRSTTTFIGSPIIKKVVSLLSNKKIDGGFEHLHLLSPFQKYTIAQRRGFQLHAQSELPIETTINAVADTPCIASALEADYISCEADDSSAKKKVKRSGAICKPKKVQEKAALGARKKRAFSFVDSYASFARPPLVETPAVWNDVAYKGSFADTKFFDKKANKKWNRVKKYPVLATPLSFIKSSTSFDFVPYASHQPFQVAKDIGMADSKSQEQLVCAESRHMWWSNSLCELNMHLGWFYTCFVRADLMHNLRFAPHLRAASHEKMHEVHPKEVKLYSIIQNGASVPHASHQPLKRITSASHKMLQTSHQPFPNHITKSPVYFTPYTPTLRYIGDVTRVTREALHLTSLHRRCMRCKIEMHKKSWCEIALIRAFKFVSANNANIIYQKQPFSPLPDAQCTFGAKVQRAEWGAQRRSEGSRKLYTEGVKPDTEFISLICRLPKAAFDLRSPHASSRAKQPLSEVHKQISDIMSIAGDKQIEGSEVTYGGSETDNTGTPGIASALRRTVNSDEAVTQRVKIFRPWIFLGELPLMTKRGHFILNGSPRVIVNQMARCPGIYFQEKRRGVGFEQEVRVSADLIPQRGPWLRIQSDWEGRFWARLKREGRVKYATLYEAFQEFEKQYSAPLISLVTNSSSSFPKSEILAFQERKVKEDRQKKALVRFFKNSTRYSLGKQGRLRINQRVHSSQPESYSCHRQIQYRLPFESTSCNISPLGVQSKEKVQEVCIGFARDATYASLTSAVNNSGANKLIIPTPYVAHAPHLRAASHEKMHEVQYVNKANDKFIAPVGRSSLQPSQVHVKCTNVKDRKTFGPVDDREHLLMATDVNAIHLCLEHLLEGQGFTDDIDHLKNRLVRTSGKLLQQQLELGLDRLSEVMTPLLGNLIQGQLLSSLLPSQDTEKSSLHQGRASHQPKKKNLRREKKTCGPVPFHSPIASLSTEGGKSKLQPLEKQNFAEKAKKIDIHFSTEGGDKGKQVRNARSAREASAIVSSTPLISKEIRRAPQVSAADPMSVTPLMSHGVLQTSTSSRAKQPLMDQLAKRRASSPQENSALCTEGASSSSLQQTPFRWLRTSKPVNNAFREFFGSNPLSQYMDQTNPLAEITHKRRLSSMGPGGIKRETAGMEVRGIHPTHYGRVCPIETPEGKNAGLVNSPTVYGRIGKDGFMETPLYQVVESQVQKERWAFFSAQQEEFEESSLATGDTGVTRFNFLSHVPIPVQTANNPLAHFQQVERNRVGYKALSPVQTISIATALIPFLEHDDANRALMGSNMQRQAIPLLSPERPIVGTGFEPMVMSESGQAIQATKIGCVSHVSANKIILESIHSTYEAPPTVRSCEVTPPYYSRIQNGDSISNIYCKFFYTREKHNNVWWNRTVFTRCLEPPFLFKVSDASSRAKQPSTQNKNFSKASLMFNYPCLPFVSTEGVQSKEKMDNQTESLLSFSKGVIKPEMQIRFSCISTFAPLHLCTLAPKVHRASCIVHCGDAWSGEIGSENKKISDLMKLVDDNHIYNQLILDNEQTNSFLQMALVLYHRRRTAGLSGALEMQLSLRSAWKMHNQRCKQRFRLLGSCIFDLPPGISPEKKADQTTFIRNVIRSRLGANIRCSAQIYFGAPAVQRSLINFWSFLKIFCETRKNSRGFKVGNYLVSESDYVECLAPKVHVKCTTLWSASSLTHVKNSSLNSFLNSFTKSPYFRLCWVAPAVHDIVDGKQTKIQRFMAEGLRFVRSSPLMSKDIAQRLVYTKGFADHRIVRCTPNIGFSCIPTFAPSHLCTFAPKVHRASCIVHCGDAWSAKSHQPKQKERSEIAFSVSADAMSASRIFDGKRQMDNFNVNKNKPLLGLPTDAQQRRVDDFGFSHSASVQSEVHRRGKEPVNLHISKKFSHQTATNLHLCSTQSAFLFQKVEQSLQLYQRSNQETCLSQRPLVREGDWVQKGDFLADCSASHSGDLALGKNVTVAYMPWEGYNFEDAIVISDRLVANDIYTSIHIERYEIKVSKNSQGKERITNQIPSLSSQHLKHLDSSGIARVSSWVQPGDILVGKVVELKRPLSPYERLAWELASRLSPNSPEREKWLSKVWLEDISLRLPAGVCGRVINFQIISTEWSEKEHSLIPLEVHVYLAVKRKIQVGDKLAGRHGNKGIVSIVLPRQDMPYLGDGSSVDMVLNPLGVPSRMNLGQIFECLLGLAGSQLGCNFKVTPFDEIAGGEASRSLVFLKLYQCRLIYKQQWLFTPTFPGKNKLFDGRTGEPFENWVTVGQAYMLKLIHMVDHKIHARSTGPYSLFTRQPVRGRSRRGGQRLGEMEVWAVEGFGAAYTLQEFLTIKSDDLKARAALQRSFYKKNDVTLGKVHISPGNPEAFRVLVSELQALCLHIQM